MSKTARIGYVEEDKRWKATVIYQVTKRETREVIHHVNELEEFQDLIERGPTFCSIQDFRIEYRGPKETIKESMKS